MQVGKHFHLVVPVWGVSYTALFADVCLPLLLTEGNLGAIKGIANNRFVIATTYIDAVYLSKHASTARLKEFIDVEFLLIDGMTNTDAAHEAMSYCYAMAMQSPYVIPSETHFIFLTPDSFWSEGTFARLQQLAENEYRVVMAMGLRTNIETMVPVLSEMIKTKPDNPAIATCELVSLALRNLHQMSKAHDWLSNGGFLNSWPSHLYWWGGEDRLVAHCFHMHPLMVCSKAGVTKIGDTIDGQFLDNLHYTLDQYYIVKNNDDFLGVELSSKDRSWGQELAVPSIHKVIKFGVLHANSRHWHFFRHRIDYRGTNYSENSLSAVATSLIDEVVNRIDLTYRTLPKSVKGIVGGLIFLLLRNANLPRRTRLMLASKRHIMNIIPPRWRRGV